MRAVSRRSFLGRGAATLAGAVLGFGVLRRTRPVWAASLAKRVAGMKYRTLGARTGLTVSEIGFGGYPIRDPDVLRHAIELGITYVDTSDDYRGGASESVIGEVMKERRKAVVLATKWHPWSRTRKEEMLAVLDGCLKRLRTDHVDVIQVHQVGQASGAGDGDGGGDPLERLTNPELLSAFDAARKAGKARFLGATGHDGDLMRVMGHVVESGKFDVILCRYNFVDYPEQQMLFERAEKAGVGVSVMKTLAGARQADLAAFRAKGVSFSQAALRWVLANPHVSSAVISISTRAQANEYAAAAGAPLTKADLDLLDGYAASRGREWCRMCHDCEPVCPAHLPVSDLLRARMYLESHGDAGHAREVWSAATAKGSPASCLGCAAPCLSACPYGVPVKRRLIEARRMLA